ncbi:MAG: hypothetical protein J07HQX50_00768 [Haloquadratum sp. J07HQX50]|nr:MAG: hypothetical protein J07HQX50_00768 [Haloquadratum sp. J07HQX50]
MRHILSKKNHITHNCYTSIYSPGHLIKRVYVRLALWNLARSSPCRRWFHFIHLPGTRQREYTISGRTRRISLDRWHCMNRHSAICSQAGHQLGPLDSLSQLPRLTASLTRLDQRERQCSASTEQTQIAKTAPSDTNYSRSVTRSKYTRYD